MKQKIGNLVLRALGLLLLVAAVLKGQELLTTPVANSDIWSNRYFLIFQVEFELALGIWLLSGLFKRPAWLAVLGCFTLFCGVTLYKGLTGAASCGCFGNVHINPWITLFVMDLPAVILLAVFRPKMETHRVLHLLHWLQPWPSLFNLALVFFIGLTAVSVSAPVLILNEPAMVTTQYEVLEPSEWIGQELPILEHIDIAEQLKTGNWLVVLYHYDCPSCAESVPKIEQMARDLQGNEDFLQIALIEVPPYGPANTGPVSPNNPCKLGKLDTSKEWFVTTPASAFIQNGEVLQSWDDNVPEFEGLINIRIRKENTVTFQDASASK